MDGESSAVMLASTEHEISATSTAGDNDQSVILVGVVVVHV